jgi:hypothetical protein
MGIPREFVHHHEDTIEAPRFRKAFNEIHGNNLPGSLRNWQRLKKARVADTLGFSTLTSVAFLYSMTDELFHQRPGEKSLDSLISHWKPRMATCRTVVQS